jgi:hypothetical protein
VESINAFLSHKYEATAVNSFFFRIFSSLTDVQFEVDAGETPTNVTRLERMIREAGAYIGIYPFESAGPSQPSLTELRQYSRYFRLELDLASRASVPALIFADSRYGNVLAASASVTQEAFDIQEILAQGDKPSTPRFAQAFSTFAGRVAASKSYRLSERKFGKVEGCVGLLLPQGGAPGGYGQEHIASLRSAVDQAGFDPVVLDWPPVLTPRLIGHLRTFDWMVVDVGAANLATGMIGYLHGAFVPCMRLMRQEEGASEPPPPALYDGVDVGYRKDILRWTDLKTLEEGFRDRLESLRSGTRRFSTLKQALDYFAEATRSKEPVFVSYSGKDAAASEPIRNALRERFQNVFDYRDGESIPAGEPWLRQIYDRMQGSSVGVPLFSSSYFGSGNCVHEMEKMIALADEGKMKIFPVKLNKGEKLDIPPEIDHLEYWRTWEHESSSNLADLITASFSKRAK